MAAKRDADGPVRIVGGRVADMIYVPTWAGFITDLALLQQESGEHAGRRRRG